jgi:hypothetical protein
MHSAWLSGGRVPMPSENLVGTQPVPLRSVVLSRVVAVYASRAPPVPELA